MFISIEWQTAPELRWALASTVSGPNRCIRRQVSCLSAKRPSVAAHQSVLAVALHGHLCANDLFTARFVAAVQAARSTRMVSEGTNFKRVTPVVRDHEQSAMGELEQPTCFSVHMHVVEKFPCKSSSSPTATFTTTFLASNNY